MIVVMSSASTTFPVVANDSILYHKMQYEQSRMAFENSSIESPALRNISNASSLSTLSIGTSIIPSTEPKVPQFGKGKRVITICANSFQHLNEKEVVWGNASYENGKKYEVVWNETSDFLQLYPYVMGDERGGDLTFEQYQLNGGYSVRHHNLYYGIELGYRALSEYRDKDPRPNNTVSDLYARLGGGYRLFRDYLMALSINVGKYKQTNELAYYNELGSQKEYHLTGVGNDFARFSGSNNNTFYKGYHVGGTLSTVRTDVQGWAASLGYQYTKREKILSDLNRLPLNKLQTHLYFATVSFSHENYGLRVEGKYTARKGNDNLFGEPTGNVYPQIGTKEQYKGAITMAKAEGYYEFLRTRCWTLEVEPKVYYMAFSNKHQASNNCFDSKDIIYGLNTKAYYIKNKNSFKLLAHFLRHSNLSITQNIYESANESLTQTLQYICSYLSNGGTSYGVSMCISRQMWGNKALTIGFGWQQTNYLKGCCNNEYDIKIQMTL